MNQLEKDIYKLLKKTPIDIVEDVDEDTQTLGRSERWRLVSERDDGTTQIGLLNMWLAAKMISEAHNLEFSDERVVDKIVSLCDNLVEYGLLKEDPDYKRQKFTLITNEELNARREERGPYSRPEHD
jgi:hypothetical protein